MANNRRSNSNRQASSGGGNRSTKSQIRNRLSNAGNKVSYNEALQIANRLDVGIDRVFNQTRRTGQQAVLGRSAAAAGYDGSGSRARFNTTAGYNSTAGSNTTAGSNSTEVSWDDWDLQMQEEQAAVMASIDASNAEFLRQQEAFSQRMTAQSNRRFGFNNTGSNPDGAPVRRRRRRRASTTAAGTRLSIGGSTASGGVSTGGVSAGNTLGIS